MGGKHQIYLLWPVWRTEVWEDREKLFHYITHKGQPLIFVAASGKLYYCNMPADLQFVCYTFANVKQVHMGALSLLEDSGSFIFSVG